jgi:V-type H+-transporting ATPase subunit a
MDKLSKFPTVRMMRYDNHNISRPTFIKTNEVTEVFQMIVDTYGVPQYQEANPAVITIATFPFFFGVMFGDMGHGSVLFAFALYLVMNAEKLKETKVGKALVGPRYLFLLMGIMATYAGFIYNEFFAIKPNLWGSCYNINVP